MLVFISGKYGQGDVERNVSSAYFVSQELWQKGFSAISPHLNTKYFGLSISHKKLIKGDLEILSKCDAIIMLEGWEESEQCVLQKQFAEERYIPVYYYPQLPKKPQTHFDYFLKVDGSRKIPKKFEKIGRFYHEKVAKINSECFMISEDEYYNQ